MGVDDVQYHDYDSTQSPEYDYNSTFDFSFYSNASSEELELFLMGGGTGTDSGGETSFTETNIKADGNVNSEKSQRLSVPFLLCSLCLTSCLDYYNKTCPDLTNCL
ncbi:hypothetical protein DNTS_008039, partial [Danionella cerebrum]